MLLLPGQENKLNVQQRSFAKDNFRMISYSQTQGLPAIRCERGKNKIAFRLN
jgi:hypothetical protein